MDKVIIGARDAFSEVLVQSMHEFRRSVFVHRLGWSLPLIEGTERDQFDNDNALYMIACDEEEHVTACARLLPTTGAYMLPELFPELLGTVAAPRDPSIWELSRFAVQLRSNTDARVLSLSSSTLKLLDHIFRYARSNGISRLALVTTTGIERLMLRARLKAHRLAAPVPINRQLCVALFIEVETNYEGSDELEATPGWVPLPSERLPSIMQA